MYIKQSNKYDCGPVAVYNCLIATGHKVRRPHLKRIRSFMGTTRRGTEVSRLFYTLVTLYPDVLITRDIKKVKKHLQKNLPCVIVFKEHTATIVMREGKITVLNMSDRGHATLNSLDVLKHVDPQPTFALVYC